MLSILQFAPIIICSVIVGRWFLSEVKKAKSANLPWFSPYFTIPGILVLMGLTAPLFIYLLMKL